MTKKEFSELAKSYIYLDGATGSNLVRAGMPSGVCPEQWILEHRDVMLELQKGYVDAGTDILYAPTFTANRVKLAEYGLEGQIKPMIKELVSISREAASRGSHPVYVAGDLTMTGEQLKPMGKMELEELIDIYKEQIDALREAGADLLVVETMMSLQEARAALIAAKETCDLPVMVTMTFEKDGRTLYGTPAGTAAIVLESLGADAIGVNCSVGPVSMRQIVADMAAATRDIPIIAKPNAGLPFLDREGKSCYSMGAEEFAEEMKVLAEAGASILGGCCGTGPEYIRGLFAVFGKGSLPQVPRRESGTRILTSERMAVAFGLEGSFHIVGERINPTGKKLLQAQLKEGNFDKVLQFAEEQERDGALILDVNMGMGGIDEKGMMLRAIEEVSGVTNLPLSLDSSHVEVLEAALRAYPGRALVNSVSLEKEKYEKLLPLVKKYGAMFILLPLSDKGLPENLEEKKRIIETVLERAYALGLTKEDVIVDGLVSTVGANKKAALETLETIRYCKEKGLATICGLSNISFGMPERSFVNTAFLTLAIREGLTMAIANPSQELLVGCALATDLLLAKEDADIRFIEYAGTVKEKREQKEAALQKKLAGAAARDDPESGVSGRRAFSGKVSGDSGKSVFSGNSGGEPGSGASFHASAERVEWGAPFKADPDGIRDRFPLGADVDNIGEQFPLRADADSIGEQFPLGADADNIGEQFPLRADADKVGQQAFSGNDSGSVKSMESVSAGLRNSGECALTGDKAHSEMAEESASRITLRNSVLKGNRNGIAAQTRDALRQGEDPSALLNEVLLPAINQVGELFDKGKYFLPQLIASAEAMKNSIEVLEPLLQQDSDSTDMPTVVIATVEGDIHDIGKNLVSLMLKNYGFRVIDLGKDVPKERIIQAARENNARIIALSALMTTTMRRMKEVIDYARAEGVDAKVMIGGAVITQDYADEIGADGYSADAAEAVRLAQRLVEDKEP